MPYQIRDWATRYENHDSKKLKKLAWVPVPNQHDGLAFRRLLSMPRGIEIFAAWNLILQVASKMPVRGVLSVDGGSLDAVDLAAITGAPADLFSVALETLCSPKIAWIEKSPDAPGENPDAPGNAPENLPIEGKNRKKEQKGKKEQAAPLGPWFGSPEFVVAWKAWEKARKKKAEHLQYADLEKLSGGDLPLAIQILNQSAAKQWTGVFPLKGAANGTHRQSRSERLDADAAELLRDLGGTPEDDRNPAQADSPVSGPRTTLSSPSFAHGG